MSCPVCHKVNTPETGVPFPSDSMRLLRYCKSLKISPKDANKDLLICFSHFESADQIKKGGKVVGVLRLAIPKRNSNNMRTNESNTAGMTLDQILAQDVGIDISHTPSTSRSESGSNSAALVDFNFLQRTSIGGQNNATPTPLTMMTNICRQNFLSVIAAQNSSQQQWMLLELTNKTLVLYRHKKSDSSPAFDQNYFKEWLITSFNLPPKAIIELSEVVQINNFCFVFVVLDEQKTAENILSMFRSASPNFYQCSLNSAKSVLVEGTLELLKQKGPTAFSFTEEPSLQQCFGQLLDSTSPSNGAEVPKIDENAWRNVADALLPAYRSLVSTPSPQQFNFNNLVTAAMGNSSSPNLNPFISSAFGIQQQPFGQSSSSHKG